MSLQFFDGFTDAHIMPKPEWGPSPQISVGNGRDGSTNSALNTSNPKYLTLPTPAATCYTGFAWTDNSSFLASNNSAGNYFLGFVGSGVVQCVLTVNASGMIELRRTNRVGALLATSSGHPPINYGQWNHGQCKCTLKADGTGVLEFRLNGVTVINFTGNTAGTSSNVESVVLSSETYSRSFDDFWVCDAVDATATQGAPNNNFLGDLKVATMFPSAEGDTVQMSLSSGTSHYQLVDETSANTSDYVYSSTSGQRDLFQMADLPAGALAPVAVRLGLYAQKSDAGVCSIKTVLKENGVSTVGSAQPLLTSWTGYFGPIRTKKPSNDTPWTVADVNGLQIGVELA